MKSVVTIILLLSYSILLLSQEKEHLYFLETDTTWRKEMFIFPINFARDINYKGVEDARFPVGWEKQESPNFWSYAFAWNIEDHDVITAAELEVDLQKYFNGLMRSKETSVDIQKKESTNNSYQYAGVVKTTDAFFTKKPMNLNVLIKQLYCTEQKKPILLFRFSPKAFDHKVWQTLEEVQLPASIASCKETKIKKIHNLINACTEYGQFNGSVLIAEKGKVIYKNGFGFANMEWDIPNKADTKHRLASVSKQFTAMLVVQLAAENKLKLDVPISTYLPDYPKKMGDKITLHHLLTHTSGIPNYTSFPTYQQIMRNPHTPMQILRLFADLELEFTPGEKFAYSNSGYVLLGIIIEKITGKSYKQVLQDKIFVPLHMKNTGYDDPQRILKNRASGYNKKANSFENANYIDMTVPYTAGALYSTVEDLYLWDQALYTETLMPKKYMALLFEKHSPAWGQHYGYGWEIGQLPIGNTRERLGVISHSGGINGFNTKITRIPSENSLIVLLNNTSDAPLYDISVAINGILHDQPYLLPKRSLAHSLMDVIEKEDIHAALVFFQKNKTSDDYHLNENEMNLSGYQLLRTNRIAEAAAMFKLNIEAYPYSFNAYDSYAEALLLLGDTTQAIEHYKKSIQLNPDHKNGFKILNDLGVNTDGLIKKVPIGQLKQLVGTYTVVDINRDWKIVIEEIDGVLFGNDGGYKYKLNSIGKDKFINSDDGATIFFDTSDKDAITFVIFGRVHFKKIKD